MEANDIFTRVPFERIRMICIDGLKVALLLDGEKEVREYNFVSAEQKNETLDIWFGCENQQSDQ